MARDPWLVVTAACEHGPGDSGELVGERGRQEIAVRKALGSPFDPWPQSAHRRGGAPLKDDVGGLHKEGPQVLIAALGDPAELGTAAGRFLFRDEAEPGGEVATLSETTAGSDRCHHGARDDRADTRYGH
jgi:hypothetical protein